ncbi:Tat pathway signal sequence domain protein [Streptomyces sp. NBC_00996]|uniref:phage baseplate protein n=1 Tax=Streptomyces sp. NBC_00996 TaxID=2903710 RepID=UPI0038670ADF|nr:Tat pathway signal sequence domain protein [Streptomyces sp. NBC_00996]
MLDRRQILRMAAAAAGAAAVPAVAVGVAQGVAHSRRTSKEDATPGSVTATQRFDLTAPSTALLREVWLSGTRVLQSFAFDNTRGHIFAVQLVDGGLQLPGETQTYSGNDRTANGDLCLTRLDTAGRILGTMYLRGFGHGVQIGVESTNSGSYLWTETHSVPALNPDGTTYTGWGDRLARFKFTNGTVLTADSPALIQYTLESGVDRTTAAIDPANNRLVVRCRVSGAWRYRLYDLADFKAGGRTTLADVAQPADLQPGYPDTFQGFTSYGSYLYLLAGTAYGTDGSVSPDGNTYITSIDWNTGAMTEQKLTKAGYSLPYREPEGMAIQIPDPNNPQTVRLCSGFASVVSDTDSRKRASIYYKDALV